MSVPLRTMTETNYGSDFDVEDDQQMSAIADAASQARKTSFCEEQHTITCPSEKILHPRSV